MFKKKNYYFPNVNLWWKEFCRDDPDQGSVADVTKDKETNDGEQGEPAHRVRDLHLHPLHRSDVDGRALHVEVVVGAEGEVADGHAEDRDDEDDLPAQVGDDR